MFDFFSFFKTLRSNKILYLNVYQRMFIFCFPFYFFYFIQSFNPVLFINLLKYESINYLLVLQHITPYQFLRNCSLTIILSSCVSFLAPTFTLRNHLTPYSIIKTTRLLLILLCRWQRRIRYNTMQHEKRGQHFKWLISINS